MKMSYQFYFKTKTKNNFVNFKFILLHSFRFYCFMELLKDGKSFESNLIKSFFKQCYKNFECLSSSFEFLLTEENILAF